MKRRSEAVVSCFVSRSFWAALKFHCPHMGMISRDILSWKGRTLHSYYKHHDSSQRNSIAEARTGGSEFCFEPLELKR